MATVEKPRYRSSVLRALDALPKPKTAKQEPAPAPAKKAAAKKSARKK